MPREPGKTPVLLNIYLQLLAVSSYSPVQFSRSVVSDFLRPYRLQHLRLPCPSLFTGVCSFARPLSWWFYQTILSSAFLFSFCLQSFPASGSFQMSQLFASGGQIMPKMAAISNPRKCLTRLRFFSISSITYNIGLSCQGRCKSTGAHMSVLFKCKYSTNFHQKKWYYLYMCKIN